MGPSNRKREYPHSGKINNMVKPYKMLKVAKLIGKTEYIKPNKKKLIKHVIRALAVAAAWAWLNHLCCLKEHNNLSTNLNIFSDKTSPIDSAFLLAM